MLDQLVLAVVAFFVAYVVLFYWRPECIVKLHQNKRKTDMQKLIGYSALFAVLTVLADSYMNDKKRHSRKTSSDFRFYY